MKIKFGEDFLVFEGGWVPLKSEIVSPVLNRGT